MPIDNHAAWARHSLYGRKLATDDQGCLVGPNDYRVATETVTSTAASTLAAAGTSLLQATAAAAYDLTPPSSAMTGTRKRIIHNSTGAAIPLLVKLSTANAGLGNFLCMLGSSFTTITLSTRGAYVDLEYISTALVSAVLQSSSTVNGPAMTTTT